MFKCKVCNKEFKIELIHKICPICKEEFHAHKNQNICLKCIKAYGLSNKELKKQELEEQMLNFVISVKEGKKKTNTC